MKKKKQYFNAVVILFIALTVACGPSRKNNAEGKELEDEHQVYKAKLSSLNQDITNQPVNGTLTITVQGDSATIEMSVSSIAPNMMHLAHLHGYEDGSEALCPPIPGADANGDGLIDLIETRNYSGITMIPFHNNPVSLEIKTETYPQANDQGNFNYSAVVSVEELTSAVREKFGIENFNFSNFVVYVHGVQKETTLPESVQSLPDVPAQITLPVACGDLE